MNIVYLHGFISSPQSLKANETRQWLAQFHPEINFYCPQLSNYPSQALPQAQDLIARLSGPTLLLGSSLGGFYVCWLAHALQLPAILINPALTPHLLLRQRPEIHFNPYTSEQFSLNEEEFTFLSQHQIHTLKPTLFWVILGSHDVTLDWRQAMRFFQGSQIV